jgi:tight adherence protein B
MLPLILTLLIFSIFGVFALLVIANMKARRRKYVMSMIQGTSEVNVKEKSKGDAQNQRRSDLAKKLQEESKEKDSKKTSLKEMIMQAGLEISIKKFWLFSLLNGIVFFVLVSFFGFAPLVKILIFITAFLGMPRLFLKQLAKKRQKDFMADFPDALESMMRLLKAGMPVSEAIKMVGEEFTGPMGEEMGYIFEQQKIGIPLPEAVLSAAERVPLTEMQMFATAISIQTQTGSSLSEVLENLASVIRARFKLRRKVKALSSEAKASAGIIAALPVVVASGMYFLNREYIEVLFTDPTGKFLLGGAIVWMLVGCLIMRQMINFRI